MKKTWMLDTNICSFIMREQPAAVLKRLEQAVCCATTALWSRP
jgi:tRNA(fMet)-specific endonuclease VapC